MLEERLPNTFWTHLLIVRELKSFNVQTFDQYILPTILIIIIGVIYILAQEKINCILLR